MNDCGDLKMDSTLISPENEVKHVHKMADIVKMQRS